MGEVFIEECDKLPSDRSHRPVDSRDRGYEPRGPGIRIITDPALSFPQEISPSDVPVDYFAAPYPPWDSITTQETLHHGSFPSHIEDVTGHSLREYWPRAGDSGVCLWDLWACFIFRHVEHLGRFGGQSLQRAFLAQLLSYLAFNQQRYTPGYGWISTQQLNWVRDIWCFFTSNHTRPFTAWQLQEVSVGDNRDRVPSPARSPIYPSEVFDPPSFRAGSLSDAEFIPIE
jgi:hypothetical protein